MIDWRTSLVKVWCESVVLGERRWSVERRLYCLRIGCQLPFELSTAAFCGLLSILSISCMTKGKENERVNVKGENGLKANICRTFGHCYLMPFSGHYEASRHKTRERINVQTWTHRDNYSNDLLGKGGFLSVIEWQDRCQWNMCIEMRL